MISPVFADMSNSFGTISIINDDDSRRGTTDGAAKEGGNGRQEKPMPAAARLRLNAVSLSFSPSHSLTRTLNSLQFSRYADEHSYDLPEHTTIFYVTTARFISPPSLSRLCLREITASLPPADERPIATRPCLRSLSSHVRLPGAFVTF